MDVWKGTTIFLSVRSLRAFLMVRKLVPYRAHSSLCEGIRAPGSYRRALMSAMSMPAIVSHLRARLSAIADVSGGRPPMPASGSR